jgi:hypothetical protein
MQNLCGAWADGTIKKQANNFIKKKTGIRNADKKQIFLQWQIKNINTGNISRIKLPNADSREIVVPEHKEKSVNDNTRKNKFPVQIKPYPLMEGKQQGQSNRKNVNE